MNTKDSRPTGIAFVLLCLLISLLFGLGPAREVGQASATADSNNEGWSISLEAENGLSVFDLVPSKSDGVLLVGEGTTEDGYFAFVIRMKPNGRIEWAKKIADISFYNVKSTSNGAYMIIGRGGRLLKLNSSGEIVWQKRYGQNTTFHDIEETTDGGFIAAGDLDSDAFLLRLSSAGNVIWWRKWLIPNQINDLIVTANNRYLLFGDSSKHDPFVAEIYDDGTLVHESLQITDSSLSAFHMAVPISEGNVLVAANTNEGPWLAKLIPDGNIGWQNTYESTAGILQFNDIKALPNGNAIIVGLIEPYQEEMDPLEENFVDGMAMEIDSNGIPQWLRTYTHGNRVEVFRSTTIDNQGNVYMAGYYEDSGNNSAWVVKLAGQGQIARCPGVNVQEVSTTLTTFDMVESGSSFSTVWPSTTKTHFTAKPLELERTIICPLPYLSIEKSGPQTAVGGVPFSYSLTVTNNAEEAYTGVVIRDKLPAGATYVSGGNPVGDEVIWDIGHLEGGAQATEQLTISARHKITNEEYHVSCAEGHSTTGDERISTQIANLSQLPVINADYCADFFDDFGDPASGWPTIDTDNWSARYVAGKYELQTKSQDAPRIIAPTCARWYYVVEADMQWKSAPGPGMGLLFDISPDGNSLSMLTLDTFDSTYQYQEIYPDGGSSTGGYSPFINAGRSKNHLRITRNRDEVIVEINGEFVNRYYVDGARGRTFVGLASISSANTPSTKVRFDNFSYTWSAPEPEQAGAQ